MKNKPVTIVASLVTLNLIFLSACGGAPGNNPNYRPPNFDPSSQGDGSNGSVDVGSVSYLDCTELNPDKVYLLGTLSPGSGDPVVVDPENPTRLCVGFEHDGGDGVSASDSPSASAISNSGKIIYSTVTSPNIYQMVPEPFASNSNADQILAYPENPIGNDVILMENNISSCGVGTILLNPVNDDIFFTCPNSRVHTAADQPYYSLGDQLLGILPDGSLLTSGARSLSIISNSLVETSLTLPDSGDVTLDIHENTAKNYVCPESQNNCVWFLVSVDGVEHRWSLDLTTQLVSDQGAYSAVPEDVTVRFSVKLDGQGALWQTGAISTTDVIMRRALEADGETEVVYSEADNEHSGRWTSDPTPFGLMHGSELVTGS